MKRKIMSEFNHRTIKDNKQQGYRSTENCWYFCSAMNRRFLCLDLNKSKSSPDNPKCYKLTRDLSPIAAERAIDIVGAKPVKINGETYFVGGEYSKVQAKYSLKPDLYRLRLQPEKKGTPEQFLLLERGVGPSMNAVKVKPIVEEIAEKLYVLHTGGGGSITPTHVFEVFDLITRTWSALPDPPFIEEGCYELESFVCGHSVIGKRLFVVTKDDNCYCFDTKQGKWHVLSPFVPSDDDDPPLSVGRVLLWHGISCGTQSSFRLRRKDYVKYKGKHHYICFSIDNIYLVDSDGMVLGEQEDAFDAIFKGLAPRPFSDLYMGSKGMTFLPSPHRGTMCAATLVHEIPEEEDEHQNMPTLCISFFRPVVNTSLVNSILDGSYLDANPGTDFTDLNLVGVEQDRGYVFDLSEHFDFDDITHLGFSGPAFFP